MYGRIENGNLIYGPVSGRWGNKHYSRLTDTILREMGFKPVITVEPPKCEQGYHAVSTWSYVGDHIEQVWVIKEDEPIEPTIFDRMEAQILYTALLNDTLLEE